MAKHGRRRRTQILKGELNDALALSTLANNTALSTNLGDTVNEKAYAISVESTHSLRDGAVSQGNILCGWAHSDYTTAEIEEWIENSGGWDAGDMISQEIAKRKIRMVGGFGSDPEDRFLNDGKMIKTRLGFYLNQGQTLKMWVYNRTGATLTTGAQYLVNGHVWLRPS